MGRGAKFDGVSGVRPAREVEPVAEADGVVDEPENRGGSNDDGGKPKSRCSEACAIPGGRAAKQRERDAGPSDERDDPAIVASEDGGHESDGDALQAAALWKRIVI